MNTDETGWQVQGQTFRLWCLTSKDAVYYLINPIRGSSVLKKLFRTFFNGMLVTDFWGAYNSVMCLAKQKCLPHLLRDLSRTRHYHNPGEDWPEFYRRLHRLIRDSMRLKKDKEGFGTGSELLAMERHASKVAEPVRPIKHIQLWSFQPGALFLSPYARASGGHRTESKRLSSPSV